MTDGSREGSRLRAGTIIGPRRGGRVSNPPLQPRRCGVFRGVTMCVRLRKGSHPHLPYRVRGRLFAGTTIIGRRAGDARESGVQTRPYSRGGVGCSVEGEEGEGPRLNLPPRWGKKGEPGSGTNFPQMGEEGGAGLRNEWTNGRMEDRLRIWLLQPGRGRGRLRLTRCGVTAGISLCRRWGARVSGGCWTRGC